MDVLFHYPPELLRLPVETIPRLCPSKKDTLLFFTGAGVPTQMTSDLSITIQTDRQSITKFELVRQVLTRLNQLGESALRPRREVLKRVVEFEDFTVCWENDRLIAQGLVSQIRSLINVKDSITQINIERQRERQEHIRKREEEASQRTVRRDAIAHLKDELFALFADGNPQRRGKKLESVLNQLFSTYGIAVRQAFAIIGDSGEGTIEQIDGVIELNGQLCFVEMKWWRDAVGVPQVSEHLTRVFVRAEARALIISASDFTAPAVTTCKEALAHRVVTLCTLQEIVMVLEHADDLAEFLRQKFQLTLMNKDPFPKISLPLAVS